MEGNAPANPERPALRVGSYLLLEPLGAGGMSSVYRARHERTGLEVAVKVLPRTLARNRTLLRRFLREAKSAEALEDPNIVAIYDRGVDQGRYYLVLEYVAGGDLHDWVRAHGAMPLGDAIAAMRSVAEGLAFAADRGLIHRDIKPANLLRTPDGKVKIADLGLALQAQDEDERVTREGTTVGTVDYMSPEQARDSRATSVRSDIYSLGCTFFFLLTGQPPFPGGDIVEKLARHATAPPPDLAAFRPDAPPSLNRLLARMLAKKPEGRFAGYAELIAALDEAAQGEEAGEDVSSLVPLDAILDDDDDDPGAGGRDGFVPLRLPAPVSLRDAGLAEDEPSMFSLAGLAESEEIPTSRVPPRLTPAAPPAESAGSGSTVEAAPPAGAYQDDEGEEELTGPAPFGPGRMSDAERSWLTRVIVAAVALVILVIGADQLIRSTSTETPEIAAIPAVPTEPQQDEAAPVVGFAPPNPAAQAPAPHASRKSEPAPKPTPTPQQVTTTEPVDEPRPVVPEVAYPAGLEARYLPDWAKDDASPRPTGLAVTVRRIPDPNEPGERASLTAALGAAAGGVVEVADNGPFFVDEFRVHGESRLVRARPGFRPVVCLESPRLQAVREQPAYCVLDDRSLELDGIDLVVDARALAPKHGSVFLVRGGTLTLRNCTVTVVNRAGASISLVQSGAADRPSRVWLERTFVRGSFSTLAELAGGAADVVVSRSAVVNGQGGAVATLGATPAAGERRVFVTRSLVATRGPAFELTEAPSARPDALIARALGSTFARLPGTTPTPLVASWEGGGPREVLAWEGEANTFAGWSAWMNGGSAPGARVPDLNAARSVWPGSDAGSRETSARWALFAPFDAVTVDRLRELDPGRADMLSQVATPTPLLTERTVDAFPPPTDPGFTPPAAGSAGPPVGEGVRDLRFEAGAPGTGGDLGRFIADSLRPGDRLVRVGVGGSGAFAFSPLRMPDGVALEIEVVADTGGRAPTWSAPRGTEGEALISVKGAGLRLMGLSLGREGSARLKSLVRVERGHLVLYRCRLTSTGPAEPGGGGLIAFSAPGSIPLTVSESPDPARSWPFDRPTDRPTCRITESALLSAGDVLTATVGRGLVVLSQCLVTAGATAFTLIPDRVARRRLHADLWLDHCTVASEANVVALGPWAGADPGPDRPWLVSTNRCAFFGYYQRPSQTSVLLRVDPEAFAHGALFWEATGDACDVPMFAGLAGTPPPEPKRPDVQHQWAGLWGTNHVRAVSGPRAPSYAPSARPLVRPRPGRVEPGELFLDPSYRPDSPPARDLGADLARLGFVPARPSRRP